MEIVQVSDAEAAKYVETLRILIKSTIKLPPEAIQHFINQWTAERIQNCLNNYVFLMAREHNKITGVVLGSPVEGGVGTIIWVLVDATIQKRGIGALMFKEACKIYRNKGAHKVKLTVPEEQTVSFYLKQGMTLEGVHRDHWWHTDFWAMGINI